MYMVFAASFKKMDSKPFLFCDGEDRLFQELFDFRGDDPLPVFYRPHHMVINVADTSPIMYKIIFHTHSITKWTCSVKNMAAVSR